MVDVFYVAMNIASEQTNQRTNIHAYFLTGIESRERERKIELLCAVCECMYFYIILVNMGLLYVNIYVY